MMKFSKKLNINIFIVFMVIIVSVVYSGKIKNTVPIYRVCTEEKKVALTFDVNWAENEYIYEILDVLNENNAKGTFFIMGGWVNYSDENREKLMKINEGGHEIGNHSYIHPSFTKINHERMADEIKKTEDIIYAATGNKTKVFRFPSGDYNQDALEYVRSLGYECIQWDVDSIDYKESGADVEYNRIMKNIKEGSIALFHNNAKYTPQNLKKIINKLTEDGYEFVTISELIYDDNYYVDEKGEQIKK
mgnify:CR=1 FL=1